MHFEHLNGHKDSPIYRCILLHLYGEYREKVPNGKFEEVIVQRRDLEKIILGGDKKGMNITNIPYNVLEPHLTDEKRKIRTDSYSEFLGNMSNPPAFGNGEVKPLIHAYANQSCSLTEYGKDFVESNLVNLK